MTEIEKLQAGYQEMVKIVERGRGEIGSIAKVTDVILSGPAKAHAEYDVAIDAGDKAAADKALDQIAAARKKVSGMPDRYVDLRKTVAKLYERQGKLLSNSGELWKIGRAHV